MTHIPAKSGDFLHDAGTEVGVVFLGREIDRFQSRLQLAIHEGHLEFKFKIRNGAEAANNGENSMLAGKIHKQALEWQNGDGRVITESFAQHGDALLDAVGIPVPKVLDFEQALHCDAVIMKPVDSFSGRGITIVKKPTLDSLQEAYSLGCEVSKTRTALIEEFVSGQLYSHSAFLQAGKVVADFVVQEDCTNNPFTVDTSKVAFDFPEKLLESLRTDASKLFNGLGLVDGLIHSQFILSGDRYWIIEVTRRCPGDLYALLIEMSTGYPYGASYAASFLGGAPLPQNAGTLQKRIIRHTATSKDGDSLWGFSFKQPVNLKLFVPLATAGDFIKSSPHGRAGLFFLEAQSSREQESLYESLLAGSLYGFNYK